MSEVMLAVVLLALSAVVVGGIINTSIKTAEYSRNFVIAQSLVSEGVEGIINMRNSNWLKYPANPECWLVVNPDPGSCPAFMADAGVNYFNANMDWQWYLEEGPVANFNPEAEEIDEIYRLQLVSLGATGETKVYMDSAAEETNSVPSEFFRHVIFESIAPDQSQAVATVTVAWKEGAKERYVSRTFVLYNF